MNMENFMIEMNMGFNQFVWFKCVQPIPKNLKLLRSVIIPFRNTESADGILKVSCFPIKRSRKCRMNGMVCNSQNEINKGKACIEVWVMSMVLTPTGRRPIPIRYNYHPECAEKIFQKLNEGGFFKGKEKEYEAFSEMITNAKNFISKSTRK